MDPKRKAASVWRFGRFEIDGRTAELRRDGIAIKLQEQPAQLLLLLLEHAGELVSRTELREKLWAADTFVEFDHALNTAVMKLREALGDSREGPLYIQTVPRKGYRFVAPVAYIPASDADPAEAAPQPHQASSDLRQQSKPDDKPLSAGPEGEGTKSTWRLTTATDTSPASATAPAPPSPLDGRMRAWRVVLISAAVLLLAAAGALIPKLGHQPATSARELTRLTFDEGLQTHPTWSPDGRFLAYSSDKGGATNIWVQQISGGDPIQVTRGPGPNWQPAWSPDGKFIAYRSDAGATGIFIVPALGGAGQERMIAPFGYEPRWSPDSSQLLIQTGRGYNGASSLDVVSLSGELPHAVLGDFFKSHRGIWEMSAAWHPDGRRLTVWALDPTQPGPSPSFWTVTLDGKQAVKTAIPPAIEKSFSDLQTQGTNEWVADSHFSWAPAGDALYLELTLRGARSIWRLGIDPNSLRATALERLTTGGTLDAAPAISPDGKTVAFTAERERISAWMYPLDADHGKIVGTGQPITSPGIDAWLTDVTADGGKLVFSGVRGGEGRLWTKSLPDGVETPLFVDDYFRNIPQWSRDGNYLAYRRTQHGSDMSQIMIWSAETGQEQPLTSLRPSARTEAELVYDWSPDGRTVLITRSKLEGPKQEIGYEPVGRFRNESSWAIPVAAAPHAELQEHVIISDPQYSIYQAHFSPDGQWIAFEVVKPTEVSGVDQSLLYVMRAGGGPWIALTPEEAWADKPRWSPDGHLIYFLSGRGSFFDVRAIPFDPERGRPRGKAFPVAKFDSPSLSVPPHLGNVEISVTRRSLVLTLQQLTGSIWLLGKVAQ